jgi:Zn-dependent protease with chaperone function
VRVHGLFDWTRRNDFRAVLYLFTFAALTQPMAMAFLVIPLVWVDPHHAPWWGWAGYGARYAPLVAIASAIYFGVRMWYNVNSVRRDLPFRFVDRGEEPRLCGLVEPLAVTAGVRAPQVGVIEDRAMNAFACGVAPQRAVAVFTRGLIDGLDDDELSAVIAHELIHIRNGDTRLIAASNVFIEGLALLASAAKRKWLIVLSANLTAIVFFFFLIAPAGYLLRRFGRASRLLISSAREFVADAEAIQLTQNPAAFVSALRRIEGHSALVGAGPVLDAMMIDGATAGELASHPSIAERIQAIVATTGSLALEARPRRDTRETLARAEASKPEEEGRSGASPIALRGLMRAAVTGEAPRQSPLQAFLRVGDEGGSKAPWKGFVAVVAVFAVLAYYAPGGPLSFARTMLASFRVANKGYPVSHYEALDMVRKEAGLSGADSELPPSYPLPLHESWLRLRKGNLADFVAASHCGVPVVVKVSGETDRTVAWSVMSEGEEAIRVVADLSAEGDAATHVALEIVDRQKNVTVSASDARGTQTAQAVFRPTLDPPLRRNFNALIGALIDKRPYALPPISYSYDLVSDIVTDARCKVQRVLAESGGKFSIHDVAQQGPGFQ